MSRFSELKKRNLLSNESMSIIRGGRKVQRLPDSNTGTCGYKTDYGIIQCNVSKAEALFMVENGDLGYWCCDSCAQSSYCG